MQCAATKTNTERCCIEFTYFFLLFFLFFSCAGRYAERIGDGSAIFMATVLEYLTSEILELAGNATKESRGKRVAPRHILLAVRKDEELNELLKHVTISQGGVLANIHQVLLPKPTRNRGNNKESQPDNDDHVEEEDDGEDGEEEDEEVDDEDEEMDADDTSA